METVLVTGCAGFIGMHVAKKLLEEGHKVVGVDNLNDYYVISLKEARLHELKKFKNFTFYKQDISSELNISEKIDTICHLAAQAGVQHSNNFPISYETSNNLGTLQIFGFARKNKIKKVIYASSSSVYGNASNPPFKESEIADKPISLYAATKRSNELYAHTYHHLHGIKMIGLRFFTVYGPWGRPDMAPFKFTQKILNGETIDVYNFGKMKRDFTFIDDIVDGVMLALKSNFDFEIFNLARGETVELIDFIKEIEKCAGKKAKMNMMPIQPGDVLLTSGDISLAKEKLGYNPKTSISEGMKQFVGWYKTYHKHA